MFGPKTFKIKNKKEEAFLSKIGPLLNGRLKCDKLR